MLGQNSYDEFNKHGGDYEQNAHIPQTATLIEGDILDAFRNTAEMSEYSYIKISTDRFAQDGAYTIIPRLCDGFWFEHFVDCFYEVGDTRTHVDACMKFVKIPHHARVMFKHEYQHHEICLCFAPIKK
jgi:hypothetical protein